MLNSYQPYVMHTENLWLKWILIVLIIATIYTGIIAFKKKK